MSSSRLLHEFPLHYDAVVGFLRRRTGSADEAREVAHDTWVRLAEAPADPVAEPARIEDPHRYYCTVAANLQLDRQRRAQWLHQHLAQGLAVQAGATHAPDVADGLMYRQAVAALDAALAALPARARQVFEAHRFHGEPQAAIATRLGVALNTVERDLAAAHDHIAAALRRWRGEKAARGGGAGSPRGRRKSLASLLGLGAVGVLGAGGVWRYWRQQAQQWQAAYATPHGRRLAPQPLPDGSTLALDAQSRAEAVFDAHRRAVRLLQGAAFFAVASEPARPFVVEAGAVTVSVLGTRFGVELEPSGAVLVQVESGRVRVQRGDQLLADGLAAGQGLRVPVGEGAASPAHGPAAPWREGRLHFDTTPLGDALQRLARYSSLALRADAGAAPLRVSGTVEIAHAHDWLQALPTALPVRVRRQPDGGVLVARR
ncbi:sigma-70 family RNA polymerase sigma factor [Ottowia sp.]|uniref:sigma-70 family RNA polymerase sigma factor n=1 Tax=Ottowia sp. TaxID=1898956 RepID=UPI0039E55319